MIVVNTCGGLGNQLFQYAVGRRLAVAHGVELVLDTSWYRSVRRGVTARQFELFDFKVSARETDLKEARAVRNTTHRLWRYCPFLKRYTLLREKSPLFQPDVSLAEDDSYLLGYWQSPRYFGEIASVLREDLSIRIELSPEERMLEASIKRSANAVAVHVRRGDYVTLAAAANFHGTCGVDYYKRAVVELQRSISDPTYFIFSDDIEWAQSNLGFIPQAVFVSGHEGRPSCIGIHLMASCRHNIIANSSYSWWGAWIGEPLGRVVIAPEQWSLRGPRSLDLLPTAWTAL